ncbi:MAG: PilZ domain-containing protein [Deltaproteobacteria bacterium]|jgi:c-di-GMP-binding flagellar brake protein YcgR|nr:PilZ domain-containing protein [Deltaproteobacteria bacterium]
MPDSARKPATDKRRHGRLSRTFAVEINILSFPANPGRAVEARCYDISEGGLSVESPRIFDVGDKLQVRINIPLLNKFSPGFFKVYENDAEQYFLAIAEVMWSKARGGSNLIGMRYINVDEDQARALAGLIRKAFRSGSG